MKIIIEKEKKETKQKNNNNASVTAERNEVESLFISCIEEVRTEIMKRRLKNDIMH